MNLVIFLIELLSIPLLILNIFGGLVSIVWLFILGEWKPVLFGSAIVLGSPMLITILLIPTMVIGTLAEKLYERNKDSKLIDNTLGLLGHVWMYAIMCLCAYGIFFYFMRNYTNDTHIPLLIWSYVVTVSGWKYLAGKNALSALTLLFLEIGCLGIVTSLLFFNIPIEKAIIILIISMIVDYATYYFLPGAHTNIN